MSTPTKPHLLTLPAELRNNIYTHLFQNTTIPLTHTHTLPSLLRTNKKLHHEATSIYYSETTFTSNRSPEHFALRITTLPHNSRKHIGKVIIDLPEVAKQLLSYESIVHDFPIGGLIRLAREAQDNLFRFREQLTRHGMSNLAAKAQAKIILNPSGECATTTDPWQAFFAGLLSEQARYCRPRVTHFFDYEHTVPSQCWLLYWFWVSLNGDAWRCGCPSKVESAARNVSEGQENGSSTELSTTQERSGVDGSSRALGFIHELRRRRPSDHREYQFAEELMTLYQQAGF